MECVFITGGAGFIGSNLVHRAIDSGTKLVNLDALTYAGSLANLEGRMERPDHVFVHGSINDRPLLDELLATHRPGGVINCAAESHVDRSIDAPAAFVETNVVGTFTMLEAALAYWEKLPGPERDAFRFLHVSTDEVYGSATTGAFTEKTAYAPNSPYAASKASADHLVRAYGCTYGLPTLITNCGNNYGPRQFPEKLIPLMLLNAMAEAPLPLYGDGKQVRDWIHVDDHCDALLRVLGRGMPGETYLVGGAGEERSNLQVVTALCLVLDELRPRPGGGTHAELIQFVADRPGHDRRYAIDAAKIERDLDWTPRISFEDGLRSTVQWYRANRSWRDAIRDDAYQGERLGLSRAASVT